MKPYAVMCFFLVVVAINLSHAQIPSVISYTLINADSEKDLLEFSPGATTTIDLAALPTKNLNIRANTNPVKTGSVRQVLTGAQSKTSLESSAPYALYGDNNGNYNAWTPALGQYTLTATPYSSGNGGGTAGTSLTITFEVINQTSTNQLPVANAGNNQVIYEPAASVMLSGSGSDADGTISGYTWSQVSGPGNATFSSTAVPQPTVSNLIKGDYVFSLVVRDNQNALSLADQVGVSVIEMSPPVISGELKKWHKITITFSGPGTSETAAANPFLDYRLEVTFSQGSQQLKVPGFYAADGNAGETGNNAGNKWRVHFSPPATGTWSYATSFRTGPGIAAETSATAGNAVAFDGETGTIEVAPSDKTGADFRAKGRLRYTGAHYLQFAETGDFFIKGGAGSPENFLAYQDFDNTYKQFQQSEQTKSYSAHVADWTAGDPTWKGDKGKGMIGALNYLAGKGMNSVYFLTMNVNGDGNDVWPWTSPNDRYRYDVSKLDQWEIVFSHMDQLGILMHVVTQETENDQLLDGGELGLQRKIYYRELIARFGHHLAIAWNLGEENTNTDAQRKAFSDYFRQLDPYKSFITIHTEPGQLATVYTPLLGYPSLEGPSLQVYAISSVHQETLKWVDQSAATGHKWVVNLDEIGPANEGVLPDSIDPGHNQIRKKALWGNLMAGGGGVDWYLGSSDQSGEEWRSRDKMWDQTRFALQFFQQHLPYWQMANDNLLTSNTADYCLSLPGEAYAIYLPDGGSTTLNVGTFNTNYQVKWYNPRTGGALQDGSIMLISGSGNQAVGTPPADPTLDWICLVTRSSTPPISAPESFRTDAYSSSLRKVKPENLKLQQEIAAPYVAVNPNPFRDQATLVVELQQAQPIEVSITDLFGKQIFMKTFSRVSSYSKNLDMSQVPQGVYLLQIKCGSEYLTKRVIKY